MSKIAITVDNAELEAIKGRTGMTTVIYECRQNDNDPGANKPSDVNVPLAAVTVGPDYDGSEDLPPEISKMFWDSVLAAGIDDHAAAPTKIMVYVETFRNEPQPWPVFVVVNNVYDTDETDPMPYTCVAEFYPKEEVEVAQ